MPVNTDDGLHVAGDGPRLVRACCRLGVWFLACMPQRSPGSSVTSGTSTTTALIPTGWPSTADPESPSEDEPGGRGPPGPSSGADAGQRSRLPVAPPTVSDFASRVSWLIDHCCARAWSLSCARPATWRQARGNSGTRTLPWLDIRSAMAQSYQLLISDRCSSPPSSSSTSPPSR